MFIIFYLRYAWSFYNIHIIIKPQNTVILSNICEQSSLHTITEFTQHNLRYQCPQNPVFLTNFYTISKKIVGYDINWGKREHPVLGVTLKKTLCIFGRTKVPGKSWGVMGGSWGFWGVSGSLERVFRSSLVLS